MPELPEVETVRARLEPALAGRVLDSVEILDSRLTRPLDPVQVAAGLQGERVLAVERRGKYLLLRFESGSVLVIHLRMTGSFNHVRAGAAPDQSHVRAIVRLDDGSILVYRDVRRFGTWLVLSAEELDGYLGERLGLEPLDTTFSARLLTERLRRRRAPIKAALLDQQTLAGMGNIYADEALWRARLHPRRPAGELDQAEIRALQRGIRAALEAGIARQGATLRDYRLPNGDPGRMQDEFKVYGRTGEPCFRCGTPIEKTRLAGRGTWFCPRCQPWPNEGPRRGGEREGKPAQVSVE
ncbi:MAG TPA: bifunctional DNA-formamidopyrimidine glycosylase/DNA-(apurinic or apyrimidinic site) lyase [Gaiellaceae bacterium]